MTRFPCAALVAAALAAPVAVRAADAPAPVKKIVFLAGPKEHGPPGRHEYEKDLRELAWSLEHATNLKGLKTEVIVGRPPRDLSVYQDAAAIVVDGNGGWLKSETGMLFPQDQETDGRTYDPAATAWLKSFDALIRQKHIGLAVFHYTLWVDNWVGRAQWLDWLGGMWVPYASHNPVDSWSVRPLAARHPVLNGVMPWVYREEMYSHYFLFENPRRTELLEALPGDPKNGGWSPVSWAYDRPDGGRSFVWGGSDFHDNLHTVGDYRRYLLNGIAWTAGLEVPAEGVRAPAQPLSPGE